LKATILELSPEVRRMSVEIISCKEG